MRKGKRDPDIRYDVWEPLREFEAEPPAHMWQSIRNRLTGSLIQDRAPSGRGSPLGWAGSPYRLYPALILLGLAMILVLIWVGVKPSHHITGRGYIQDQELTRGTAYLFRVHDRNIPFDSVRFCAKTALDSTGKFEFRNVPKGGYLVRVQVHPESPFASRYHHGYSGDRLHWDSATLIQAHTGDTCYGIHIPALSGE